MPANRQDSHLPPPVLLAEISEEVEEPLRLCLVALILVVAQPAPRRILCRVMIQGHESTAEGFVFVQCAGREGCKVAPESGRRVQAKKQLCLTLLASASSEGQVRIRSAAKSSFFVLRSATCDGHHTHTHTHTHISPLL